jgi:hypothetical protein
MNLYKLLSEQQYVIYGQTASYFNLLKTNVICFISGISSYRAVKTFHHGNKNQPFNDV